MPDLDPSIHVRICSRYEEIELVDAVAAAVLEHLKFDEDTADNVRLAIREAVANGVQHGNKLQAEKPVDVHIKIDGGDFVIQVEDEGAGFKPEEVPDPLAPERLLKPSGRGIFLMRRLVDSVDFAFRDSGATQVTMRKRIPPPTERPASSEEESL